MNFEYIIKIFNQILEGTKFTVGLFFITILVSVPLGMILSFFKNSKIAPVRWILGGYVWIMRGTPLLLQLYFFYYGLAAIGGQGSILTMDRFPAACIAFCLNYAAYFCEIFRGGLMSVDKGQYEAAKVLGFNQWQTSLRIVIPQMLRVSIPSVANESITLVKDTSLITVIGITEILYFTKAAVNRDVNLTAYVVAAVFYLVFTLILTQLFKFLEKRLAY